MDYRSVMGVVLRGHLILEGTTKMFPDSVTSIGDSAFAGCNLLLLLLKYKAYSKVIQDLTEDFRHFGIGLVVPRLWNRPSGRSNSDTACDGPGLIMPLALLKHLTTAKVQINSEMTKQKLDK